MRPGRVMAVLAGCDRDETPRTGGVRGFRHRSGRRSDLRRGSAREKPHLPESRDEDAGNSTLPAAFRHFRALSRPGKRARNAAAALTVAIAPTRTAALN